MCAAEEETVGKRVKADRIDPHWPADPGHDHPVTELAADRQGPLSPYGALEFPLPSDSLSYEHPETVINR
jgi:hypothetical protein